MRFGRQRQPTIKIARQQYVIVKFAGQDFAFVKTARQQFPNVHFARQQFPIALFEMAIAIFYHAICKIRTSYCVICKICKIRIWCQANSIISSTSCHATCNLQVSSMLSCNLQDSSFLCSVFNLAISYWEIQKIASVSIPQFFCCATCAIMTSSRAIFTVAFCHRVISTIGASD